MLEVNPLHVFFICLLFIFSAQTSFAQQTEKFYSLWGHYVQSAEKVPLQNGCKPELISASHKVPFRGTIILHHGFTVCPQIFEEWGGHELADAGFDVLLPLLPGHGREWIGVNQAYNDLTALPSRKNGDEVFDKLVHDLNQVMREAAGARIIGGFSVGGAVAVASVLEDPDLYQRVILFSPFFRLSEVQVDNFGSDQYWLRVLQGIAGPLNRRKADILDFISNPNSHLNWIATERQSWGDKCEVNERKMGRAGYCQFTLDSVSAFQQLGLKVLQKISQARNLPVFQIFAMERDPTASTLYMRRFAESVERTSGKKVNFCFFKSDTNHSLLSRYDDPEQKKYWMPWMFESGKNFVVSGATAQTEDQSSLPDEGGYPLCGLSSYELNTE